MTTEITLTKSAWSDLGPGPIAFQAKSGAPILYVVDTAAPAPGASGQFAEYGGTLGSPGFRVYARARKADVAIVTSSVSGGSSATLNQPNVGATLLTGTAPPYSAVAVYKNTSPVVIGVGFADASGAWSLAISAAVAGDIFRTAGGGGALVLAVPAPLAISGSAAQATAGTAYAFDPAISGGTAPYSVTYSAPTGQTGKPTAFGVSSSTGKVSGTTAQTGTFTFRLTVTDSAGATAFLDVSIVVASNASVPTYTGPAVGTYAQNRPGVTRDFYEWGGGVPAGAFTDAHSGRGDYNPAGTFAGELQDWESVDYSLKENGWIGPGHEVRLAMPMFPKSGNFTDALAGNYDNYLRNAAIKAHNALNATQDEYHIRFGWEQNGNFQPWMIVKNGVVDAGLAAQYVAWWRKARAIFKSVSPKFKMNFCVNLGSFDWRASWPGDDQVDYIGMDVYPAIGNYAYRAPNVISDAAQRALWDTTLNRPFGLADFAAFGAEKGKPITIPEFAIEFDNGQVFMGLFWDWMVALKVKDIGWWNESDVKNVVSKISAGEIPATGEFVRNKMNPVGYPARVNVAPALNWRLAITGAVVDSAGDATTQTTVQQSSANKRHALVPLAINQTRTLTIPVAAVAAPGGLVYLNVDKFNSIVYSSDTGVTSTVEITRDDGSTYSTLSLAQGDTLDRGRAYFIPAGAAGKLRVTMANAASGAVAMNAYFGAFQLPTSGRIDSWGVWGASFQAFGAHPRRYTDAIQAANPGSDPIVFNRAVSGSTAKMISEKFVAELPSFPYLSFVYPNQAGNTLGPLARPLVPVNGDIANMKSDITAIITAARNADKVLLHSDISYRDLGPTYVADNTAPQNGPFPVNRDVIWPLFSSLTPDMIDPITGVTRANEYGLFMYLRDTILNVNDQHPQDGYAALNDMHAKFFGAYVYGRPWPKSVYLTAVEALEAGKTVDLKNRAYELAQSLPGNTVQSAYTKAALLRRIAAITVALPAMTTAPTLAGTAQVGQVLTLTFGAASNLPLFLGWTLRRDDGTIAASGVAPRRGVHPDGTNYATKPYTFVSADLGRALSLEVTPVNAQGSGTLVATAATAVVAAAGAAAPAPAVPVALTAPTYSGTPQVGVPYNFGPGTYSNDPTGYTRQIYIDNVAVSGATSLTYTPTANDAGKVLKIGEIATNAAGSSSPVNYSTATLVVAAASSGGTTGAGTSLRPTTTNLLTAPTTFTDWTNSGSNVTVTPGQSDGLGGTTATSLVPTTTSENKRISKTISGLTSGGNYRWYVEVARIGTGPGSRYANLDWGAAAGFDLANPGGGSAAIAKNGTAGACNITDLGDGFIAIEMTATSANTATVAALRLENGFSATNAGFAGDGVSGSGIKVRYAHFGPVA